MRERKQIKRLYSMKNPHAHKEYVLYLKSTQISNVRKDITTILWMLWFCLNVTFAAIECSLSSLALLDEIASSEFLSKIAPVQFLFCSSNSVPL
jgi:hypothetical protein